MIQKKRKRTGKVVVLGLKPIILNDIRRKYGENKFFKSGFVELVKKHRLNESQATNFLERLRTSGWLASKIIKNKKKDVRWYALSKSKAIKYDKKYGFMNQNAPLWTSREPKVQYIEEQIPVEVGIPDKDRKVGEYLKWKQ